MKKIFVIAAILLSLVQAWPAHAKVTGNLSASFFELKDDSSAYKYNYWDTRVKLTASEFMGENKFINLDARTRGTGESDLNENIPETRIRDANLEIQKGFWNTDLVLGRHYVADVPGAGIDGVSLKHYTGELSGFGMFGGTQPDPHIDRLSSEFVTYGLFGFKREKKYGISGGYASSIYNGKEDSSFMFTNYDWRINDKLNVYASGRGDHNVLDGGFDLTHLLATVGYRIGRVARLGFTYYQYRAVQLYESMDYDINRELQKSYRVNGTLNISRGTNLYARYDHRTRESDNKSAEMYTLGLRKSGLFRYLFFDFSYNDINYFTSQSNTYRTSLGADISTNISAEVNATVMENSQDKASNKLRQTMYGGSLNWYKGKSFYGSVSYEISEEKYLDVDSVFIAQADNEWRSSSVFALIGYRF
ncbi:MAG: hypothetical protein OEY64_04015 [Nitrospinota bacterium]|nr:hypothetical protein [Nitrospinota bacterium]